MSVCVGLQLAVQPFLKIGVHVDPQHISHHMTRASSTCGHVHMQARSALSNFSCNRFE